jgi:hypothetical protein
MLMKLNENAVVNNIKTVSLFFKRAGQIKIQAKVGLR